MLRFALEVLATDGVQGDLVIHIPRKTDDLLEVEFFGINPRKE